MEIQEKAWVYLIPGTQVQADELPLCHLSRAYVMKLSLLPQALM